MLYKLLSLAFILYSCAGKISGNKKLAYDSSYVQFWTADLSPDDKLVAVGGVDSILRIYYIKDLKLYRYYPMNTWIHVVRWHPDGKSLAIGTLANYVQLLDIETGKITGLNSKGGSRALGWNQNGQLLAVGGLDGEMKIWNKQGDLVSTSNFNYGSDVTGGAYTGLDWHPYKNQLVAVNFQINLFDTTCRLLKIMEHTNKEAIMLCVKWHPSDEFFVIGDYGHNWEGENVPSLLHFWTPGGKKLNTATGSRAEYRNISWNKEGTKLATASDVLRIWTKDGTLLHESDPDSTNYLWAIDWNKGGSKIVTGSRYRTIAVWDSTAKLLKRIDVASTHQKK